MKKEFMKMAGVKNEKDFYAKYPSESHFLEAFPQAVKMVESFKRGGQLSGAPHNGQPTAAEFFNYGRPTPNFPRLFQGGGQPIVIPDTDYSTVPRGTWFPTFKDSMGTIPGDTLYPPNLGDYVPMDPSMMAYGGTPQYQDAGQTPDETLMNLGFGPVRGNTIPMEKAAAGIPEITRNQTPKGKRVDPKTGLTFGQAFRKAYDAGEGNFSWMDSSFSTEMADKSVKPKSKKGTVPRPGTPAGGNKSIKSVPTPKPAARPSYGGNKNITSVPVPRAAAQEAVEEPGQSIISDGYNPYNPIEENTSNYAPSIQAILQGFNRRDDLQRYTRARPPYNFYEQMGMEPEMRPYKHRDEQGRVYNMGGEPCYDCLPHAQAGTQTPPEDEGMTTMQYLDLLPWRAAGAYGAVEAAKPLLRGAAPYVKGAAKYLGKNAEALLQKLGGKKNALKQLAMFTTVEQLMRYAPDLYEYMFPPEPEYKEPVPTPTVTPQAPRPTDYNPMMRKQQSGGSAPMNSTQDSIIDTKREALLKFMQENQMKQQMNQGGGYYNYGGQKKKLPSYQDYGQVGTSVTGLTPAPGVQSYGTNWGQNAFGTAAPPMPENPYNQVVPQAPAQSGKVNRFADLGPSPNAAAYGPWGGAQDTSSFDAGEMAGYEPTMMDPEQKASAPVTPEQVCPGTDMIWNPKTQRCEKKGRRWQDYIPNTEAIVGKGITFMNKIAERIERKDHKGDKNRLLNMMDPTRYAHAGGRLGNWGVNNEQIDPSAMTAGTMSPGPQYVPYGAYGGEMYLDDNEIEYIKRNGGSVEYLD